MSDKHDSKRYLDPEGNYSPSDIQEYLNDLGDAVDCDSKLVLNDGSLLAGDFIVWIHSIKKWMLVRETYATPNSSYYKVTYYSTKRVPQTIFQEAAEFDAYINSTY